MKIIVINSLYKPYSRGGTEVVVGNIVQALAERGEDVKVITTDKFTSLKSLKPKQEEIEGVKVWRFFPLNIFSFINIKDKPYFARLIWHVFDMFNCHSYFNNRKILKKEKPDLVLVHNLKGLGYLIPRLLKKLKLNAIFTIHDVSLVEPSGLIFYCREKMNFVNKIFMSLTRHLFASVEKVVFPSKWLKNFYFEKGYFKRSRVYQIYNPVVLNNQDSNEQENKNNLIYGFVGQIEKHKGVEMLIKSFLEFKKGKKDVLLWLVGQGSLFDRLKEKYDTDKQIRFWGQLDRTALFKQIYGKLDYLVYPSICYENLPTTIIEAFSAKVPVLASDLGGISELVKHGQTGYLFEPRSEFCRQALSESYRQLDKKDILGQNGYNRIINYNIDNYLSKILAL